MKGADKLLARLDEFIGEKFVHVWEEFIDEKFVHLCIAIAVFALGIIVGQSDERHEQVVRYNLVVGDAK